MSTRGVGGCRRYGVHVRRSEFKQGSFGQPRAGPASPEPTGVPRQTASNERRSSRVCGGLEQCLVDAMFNKRGRSEHGSEIPATLVAGSTTGRDAVCARTGGNTRRSSKRFTIAPYAMQYWVLRVPRPPAEIVRLQLWVPVLKTIAACEEYAIRSRHSRASAGSHRRSLNYFNRVPERSGRLRDREAVRPYARHWP